MAREAFLPLFFGDFLSSTSEWEGEERALYLLLLGYQWSLGSLPAEPRRICKLVAWDWTLFERCWAIVGQKFKVNGERCHNPRLEEHRGKSQRISDQAAESGRRGAAVRWRKDGESVASAKKSDGERHQGANGESVASATKNDGGRHQNPNGSIPSHPIPSQTSRLLSPPKIPNSAHASSQSEEASARTRTRRAGVLNGTARPRIPGTIKKSDDLSEARGKALKLLAAGNGAGDVARMLEGHYEGLTAAKVRAWAKGAPR